MYLSKEFARNGGRCDLVVSQSGTKDRPLPPKIDALGVPFLAVEFKSSHASIAGVRKGREQMAASMKHIATDRNVDQVIFGAVAWGTLCHFFFWKNDEATEWKVKGKALWNIAESEGRVEVVQYLEKIKSYAPLEKH